jgi:hypothetical protein
VFSFSVSLSEPDRDYVVHPDLLEAVATVHVRKHGFEDARDVSDRFVKLPDVKRIQLFASFAEFTPVSYSSATLV